MSFDLGALLRNAAGPAAGVMAAHKRRDASLAEKKQQLALQQVAMQRQAAQDDLQRRIGESTITRNNRAPAAPVVAPVHWERFEAKGGLYERNPVTHEVRPIREPVETETPTPPLANEGMGEQQMGAAQAGDQQSGDIDLRTPPPAPKPTLPPILQPKPPAPRAAGPEGLKQIMRNGKPVWVRDSAAEGQEAPGTAPPRDSYTPVTLGGVGGAPPVVKPFNTRTGEVGESVGTAKPPDNAVKVTDTARMTAAYVRRMGAASQTLDRMEADPKFMASLSNVYGSPSGTGQIPYVGNLTMDAPTQDYRQAQQEWVRAKLRKESGAVISKDEMRQEIETYFAQPNDSESVKRQKAASRKEVEAALREAAGRAITPQGAGGGGAQGAQPGAIDPSFAERAQQLRRQGLSRAAAQQQLKDEGYDLATGKKAGRP